MEWMVENIRLTVFPTLDVQLDASEIWNEAIGADPESINIKPKEGETECLGFIDEGKVRIRLQVSPLKLDWIISVGVYELGNLPIFANLKEARELFGKILRPWVNKHCPSISRIAVGMILLGAVENKEQAYSELDKKLKSVELDPKGSSDFSYSINRPRTSKLGMKVNRISKWAALSLRTILRTAGGGKSTEKIAPLIHACRLETDISTDHDYAGQIEQGLIDGLVEELLNFGCEISEEGDIS